jgi:hypothetical protein
MNNEQKNKLRLVTLGSSKKFERKQVEIAGEVFEIRQPTLKERGIFRKNAMNIGADESGKGKADFDIFEFQIQAVMGLTLIPGTDEKVFDESDREAFESSPSGGWFDTLASVATDLCNVSDSTIKNDSNATK